MPAPWRRHGAKVCIFSTCKITRKVFLPAFGAYLGCIFNGGQRRQPLAPRNECRIGAQAWPNNLSDAV